MTHRFQCCIARAGRRSTTGRGPGLDRGDGKMKARAKATPATNARIALYNMEESGYERTDLLAQERPGSNGRREPRPKSATPAHHIS
jgi:hypothetical protein